MLPGAGGGESTIITNQLDKRITQCTVLFPIIFPLTYFAQITV